MRLHIEVKIVAIVAMIFITLDAVTTAYLLSSPRYHEANGAAQGLFNSLGYVNVLVGRTIFVNVAALIAMAIVNRSFKGKKAHHVWVAWTFLILALVAGMGATINNSLQFLS